jgi:hypothetical protein
MAHLAHVLRQKRSRATLPCYTPTPARFKVTRLYRRTWAGQRFFALRFILRLEAGNETTRNIYSTGWRMRRRIIPPPLTPVRPIRARSNSPVRILASLTFLQGMTELPSLPRAVPPSPPSTQADRIRNPHWRCRATTSNVCPLLCKCPLSFFSPSPDVSLSAHPRIPASFLTRVLNAYPSSAALSTAVRISRFATTLGHSHVAFPSPFLLSFAHHRVST